MFVNLFAVIFNLKTAIKNGSGIVVFDSVKGPVFTDSVTGTRYTIAIVDGAIEKEVYTG